MKKNAKQNGAGHSNAAFLLIRLGEIEFSPTNTRQIDDKSLADLAASIRQNGVLQPILVRPVEAEKAKYQIVAGERRFRAAGLAELKEIPAQVRSMSDDEALSLQIIENLQREDLHPLDEAESFRRLREVMGITVREMAQRVAKDARYVARRLSLTNLIEEGREDFRKERITLAHSLEICRLAPEIQIAALTACYETKTVESREEAGGYDYVADKAKPARHVRYLQDWLMRNVHLNLQTARFQLDDARLREDGLTCVNCPQRTGRDRLLFADIKSGDTCLNPLCFQAKLQQFVQITKAEVEAKQSKPAALISTYYGSNAGMEETLGVDQYQVLEKKADRCEFAEKAVTADGTDVGKVRWICREADCKDHLGRIREPRQYSSSVPSGTTSPEQRHERKQELYDLKVDEVVRKRVMAEAIKTFDWPLDRAYLNEAVKEFFRRIPSSDQQTICEVFGWSEQKNLRFDDEAVLKELTQLDEHQLAQFLMLCSFAHYGANRDHNRRVDQSAVVKLSQERKVNHTLIDAEVRAELCPKKYKDTHDAYLEAVKAGKTAEKPVVYEQS